MTSRCSSDMPTIKRHHEDGAGSSSAGRKGKMVHYQRFTELPYINPAISAINDLGTILDLRMRKCKEERQEDKR